VTGEVKNPAGETVQRVSGEWNASLDFTSIHVRLPFLLIIMMMMMMMIKLIYHHYVRKVSEALQLQANTGLMCVFVTHVLVAKQL